MYRYDLENSVRNVFLNKYISRYLSFGILRIQKIVHHNKIINKVKVFHYSACRWQNKFLISSCKRTGKTICSNYWQNPQITAIVHYFQKQPPNVSCKKSCYLKVCKYHRKIPVLELAFNKVACLRACIFIYKNLPTQVFSCEIC